MSFVENPLCHISFLTEWLGQEFRSFLTRPSHIEPKPLALLKKFFEDHTRTRNLELLNLPKVEVDITWRAVSYVNIRQPVPAPRQQQLMIPGALPLGQAPIPLVNPFLTQILPDQPEQL